MKLLVRLLSSNAVRCLRSLNWLGGAKGMV
jgi:hypothetical protein